MTAASDARPSDGLLKPFTLPLGRWIRSPQPPGEAMTLPFFDLSQSGERLLQLAHRRASAGGDAPDVSSWEPLLQRLGTGSAEEPVKGDLDALWRCLLATFRADRFNAGLVATHQVALARIGNELRRRLSERGCPPYQVRTVDGVVEAASVLRLPFEPRGWRRRYQVELREAIGSLDARDGQVLSGVYSAKREDVAVDAENVLFYNVGSGAFSCLARTGLRFERVFEPNEGGPIYPHRLRYQQVPKGSPFLRWEQETLLARWDAVPLSRPSSSMKPAAAWWAMRHAKTEPCQTGHEAAFGLRVVLHGPSVSRSLAGVMKPLFDGVISAFHGWTGTPNEEIALRLAAQLGREPAEVGRHLFDPGPKALGPREVVLRRGDGVTWNPKDELCLAGELLAGDPDAPSGISGELFSLRARPQP